MRTIDSALEVQCSLLKSQKPSNRVWETLKGFVEHNHNAIKDKDKAFIHQDLRSDLVALASEKSEPMTAFLLKFLRRLFQTKVTSGLVL